MAAKLSLNWWIFWRLYLLVWRWLIVLTLFLDIVILITRRSCRVVRRRSLWSRCDNIIFFIVFHHLLLITPLITTLISVIIIIIYDDIIVVFRIIFVIFVLIFNILLLAIFLGLLRWCGHALIVGVLVVVGSTFLIAIAFFDFVVGYFFLIFSFSEVAILGLYKCLCTYVLVDSRF